MDIEAHLRDSLEDKKQHMEKTRGERRRKTVSGDAIIMLALVPEFN